MLTHALTRGVELGKKKHWILISFVCHIVARTLNCLVELCNNRRDIFNHTDFKMLLLTHNIQIFLPLDTINSECLINYKSTGLKPK